MRPGDITQTTLVFSTVKLVLAVNVVKDTCVTYVTFIGADCSVFGFVFTRDELDRQRVLCKAE